MFAEQMTILRVCKSLDDNRFKGRDWSKYKGSCTVNIVKDLLRGHLVGISVDVAGPNVFIKDRPTEFDLLIVTANAKPDPHFSTYYQNDVKLILEVKKNGLRCNRGGVREYFAKFDRVRQETRIPYLYITVEENSTLWDETARILGKRFFCLSRGSGEWKRFVNAVLDESEGSENRGKRASPKVAI